MLKKIKKPLIIWTVFIVVAVSLSYFTGNQFYFYNFLYIGSVVAIGTFLFQMKWKYARLFVQIFVGMYMLIYLGILSRENMQLSGFFYYLFLGVFQAATIHYFVAKIVGPVVFGRGWCGYACWTAMILDLLPFKTPKSNKRVPKLGLLRYAIFLINLIGVALLFILKVPDLEKIMFFIFIGSNILYYIVGIALAYKFGDNRAFCKYFCPVTVFLKPASYFSLFRVKKDEDKCINCNKCKKSCPMDVDMLDNKRSRENGTECILCGECVRACPTDALSI